jgi:hypothetical protein
MSRLLFIAAMFYKDMVRPITICSAIQSIYLGGLLNSMEDRIKGRKKPVYVNLLQMAKYATIGTLIGVTFPVSFPTIIMLTAIAPNPKKHN